MNGLGITEASVENQLVWRRVTFDVMKHACSLWFWPLAGVAVATWMASCGAPSHQSMTYPESRTVDVVDTLWGTAVADPYRWLEDDRDEELCKHFDDSIECLSGLQRYITSGHLLCVGEWTQNIQPNAWIPLPIQTPSVTPAPSPFAFRRDHALQMKSVSTTFAAPLQREAFDEQYDEGKRSGATPGRLRRAETMPLRPV